jgi:hypothetical protein
MKAILSQPRYQPLLWPSALGRFDEKVVLVSLA